jgi:hypothetical protein
MLQHISGPFFFVSDGIIRQMCFRFILAGIKEFVVIMNYSFRFIILSFFDPIRHLWFFSFRNTGFMAIDKGLAAG